MCLYVVYSKTVNFTIMKNMQNQEELKRVRENEVLYRKIKLFINDIQFSEMPCNTRVNIKAIVMIESDFFFLFLKWRRDLIHFSK